MLEALVQRVAGIVAKVAAKPDTRWGVVTGVNPLRVRLDADDSPLLGSPSTLVSGLSVADRVSCFVQNRRVTVIGRGQGPENKVLWTGAAYMHATQTASLREKVSDQNTGIVLVWQGYSPDGVKVSDIAYTFIPKWHVFSLNSRGVQCHIQQGASATTAYQKYVYVSDHQLSGYASNATAPRTSHVLTAVLGV